jgi:putative transposase
MPQSLVKILVHVVFSTKDRANLIKPEIEEALYGYIHGIDISELIGDIKRDSSSWIKKREAGPGDFYWQRGYGAFSVGQSQVDDVKRYIASQKEHHHRQDFKDEFRTLLNKYEVDYDERYIWD